MLIVCSEISYMYDESLESISHQLANKCWIPRVVELAIENVTHQSNLRKQYMKLDIKVSTSCTHSGVSYFNSFAATSSYSTIFIKVEAQQSLFPPQFHRLQMVSSYANFQIILSENTEIHNI